MTVQQINTIMLSVKMTAKGVSTSFSVTRIRPCMDVVWKNLLARQVLANNAENVTVKPMNHGMLMHIPIAPSTQIHQETHQKRGHIRGFGSAPLRTTKGRKPVKKAKVQT
jgi:hypothetical protein